MAKNEMQMGAGMDSGMGGAMPPEAGAMPPEAGAAGGEMIQIPRAMFQAIYDVVKNLSSGLGEFATMLENEVGGEDAEMEAGEEDEMGEMKTAKSPKMGAGPSDEEFLKGIAEEGSYK
jgi:hypothetical protein